MGRIVVPFDGGVASRYALELACKTASRTDDEVSVAYVIRLPPQLPIDAEMPAAVARAEALFAQADHLAAPAGAALVGVLVTARALGPGLVAAAVGCDLLILGPPTRRGLLRRLRFARLLRHLAAHATCEILVAYGPASAARAEQFIALQPSTNTAPANNVRTLRAYRPDGLRRVFHGLRDINA